MITVFDNNTGDRPAGSRIIELNPATSEVRSVYGGRDSEFFYSGWRGKHQNLYPDRVLITESMSGRVFEVWNDSIHLIEPPRRGLALEREGGRWTVDGLCERLPELL